jgi:pimeloyl-ACP methyl ester carboxylesterase
MRTNDKKIRKHTATLIWKSKTILFHFWAHLDAGQTPDTILFLGTGQIAKIPKWVAESAQPGVVVVEGLPHWHSDPSGQDLKEYSHAFTIRAYEAVQEIFNIDKPNLIGGSQSTPSTIWLANQLADAINNVALVFPMGINTRNFGEDNQERFSELKRRALRTARQREQSSFKDTRNLYITNLLLLIVLRGLRDGSTVNKYTVGISEDMTNEFRQLVDSQRIREHSITLFLGTKDELFPPEEIEYALQVAGIEVDMEIVHGATHSSLALKGNVPLVQRVIKKVRSSAQSIS